MAFPSFLPTGQDRYRGNLPVNWFWAKDDEKGVIGMGTPGNSLWANVGSDAMQLRGMKDMGDYLYVVAQISDTSCGVYQVDKVGNYTLIGTIATGTGPLYIVPMPSGKQILFNDNVNGYYYDLFPKLWVAGADYLAGIIVQPTAPNLLYYKCTIAGTANPTTEPTWPTTIGATVSDGSVTWECIAGVPYFAQITDPAFLGGGPAVLQDGYVVYAQPNSNEWGVSALYDCTTYDANAQATKGADIIKGILSSHLNIWLMGAKNNEIWYDAGTTPFPFAKLVGTLIEKGLIAPMSAVIGDNTVFWLNNERQVMMASGFQPKRISTDKIDKEIEKYSVVEDAISFFQVQLGHSFYWLIFPTANRTLVCDVSVSPPMWHVRSSFPDDGRHRANCYCYFNGMHLVGDHASGNIFQMAPEVFTDFYDPLVAKIQSREYRASGKLIPFPDLQLLFNCGEGGSPIPWWVDPWFQNNWCAGRTDLDPQVLMRSSKDGAKNWGAERQSSMGKLGEYNKRTFFRQNGSDFQRIFELSVSDPVSRDLLSCDWQEG